MTTRKPPYYISDWVVPRLPALLAGADIPVLVEPVSRQEAHGGHRKDSVQGEGATVDITVRQEK